MHTLNSCEFVTSEPLGSSNCHKVTSPAHFKYPSGTGEGSGHSQSGGLGSQENLKISEVHFVLEKLSQSFPKRSKLYSRGSF